MRRIYVASSWRNPHQPGVVEALRKAGHLVYDLLRGAKARGDCSATLRRVHELLCTDGDPEATLVHLGEVLDDAGAPKPVCDRGPECPSLHLNSRIHDLADQRDSLLDTLANERGEGNPPVGWAWDGSAWCRPPYVVARAQSGAFRWDVTYVDDVDGDDIVAEADTARDAMRAADRHQDEDQGARSP